MPKECLSILHLFIGSVPGGVLRYVVDLSVALREQGVEVMLAGQAGDWHSLVKQARLPWIEIPVRGGALDLWRSAKIIASEAGDRPGLVIHTHHRRATLVGRMVQRRLRSKPPLLYTLHLTDMPMGFPWRLMSDFGDHCHAPSIQAKRWLMKVANVSEDRIAVIPHGIDPGRFPPADVSARAGARRQFSLGDSQLVVTLVGRLEDPKNEMWCLDLVEAERDRAIKCTGPDPLLLVAGDGPNRPALEERIAAAGLGERVKLLGECDPLPVYQAADVLVLPSAREGFSYVCAEAMSCGVPVLRTRTAGTEEMIVENVTGRSCEIDRQAFITAAMEMLSLPRERLQEMGKAAAEHIRKNLRFDQQVASTVELYRRLVGRAGEAG